MPEDVFAIEYYSRCIIPEGPLRIVREIRDILERSRKRNERGAVTGALLFNGSHFAQHIEGPFDAVSDVFARIERDGRHTDIFVLHRDWARVRKFARWSMAFLDDRTGENIPLGRTRLGCAVREESAGGRAVLAMFRYILGERSA